jgi:hypothetical protein
MSEGTVQQKFVLYTAGLLKKLQLDSPCEVINATSIELSALIIVKNKYTNKKGALRLFRTPSDMNVI